MIIIPQIFNGFPEMAAGQSTRLGGKSEAPYYSLNLGKSVGDNIETVLENRKTFFGELDFELNQVVFSHQVHGSEILKVEKSGDYSGFDAQITNIPAICLAVSIADCTPILIYDSQNKAIGAVHAGWRGTVANILLKTMDAMATEYGTKGENCYAYIGACISKTNFEVGNEVAENFNSQFKIFDPSKNKFFVDLKAANKAQLVEFGIPQSQIEVAEYCTVANNELFFSHRKEKGITGRMLAAIGLKKP
ncbi:MAG: peptidoglycan editing factor PgeF [Bacteroidota bacterium]